MSTSQQQSEQSRKRIGEYDLPTRFSRFLPRPATYFMFGALCAVAAIALRYLLSFSIGGAGPYSLIYPAILIATLFGRWQSGLICYVLSFLYSWYFILPFVGSLEFQNPQDAPRTLVNGAAALVIVIFAETFRRAVQRAGHERDSELAAKELLLRELDHRTKNNFAMVASLLDLQRRQHVGGEAYDVLTTASARVQSFAAIHTSLYSGHRFVEDVSMCDYLGALTDQLQAALFEDGLVDITSDCSDVMMPRDRALAIGLVTNEIVTNAAKHAFDDGAAGTIQIIFRAASVDEWQLSIQDDGKGMPEGKSINRADGGLGSRLMDAFTKKAGASLTVDRLERGTRFNLTAD